MKLVVEKKIDGKQFFEVVEADNASQAVNKCDGLSFDENGKPVMDNREIGYVGVYEIGQINLLDLQAEKIAVHGFYQKKLKEIGINPVTFEKL